MMEALTGAIKALRPWQMVVLVVAMFGAAAVTYNLYTSSTSANDSNLTANQVAYTVQYGNLTNQVSTSGSLTFPNREELSFGAAGTVESVSVVEGQSVKKGDPVAQLDSTVVAQLEQNVAQARVTLQDQSSRPALVPSSS